MTPMLRSLLLLAVLAPFAVGDEPKSTPAKNAALSFRKAIASADDAYDRRYEEAKKNYAAELQEARKAALAANDLDEAQRIVEVIKGLGDESANMKMIEMRKRLAGTSWRYTASEVVTFHGDGTLTANWLKSKGFWSVNPDLSVSWWSADGPYVTVMRFNANLTEHRAVVPTMPQATRAGPRVK